MNVVPRVATPTDELSLAAILRDAHRHAFDADPTPARLGVAWAHVALENSRGAALWCFNYGNITAGSSWKGDAYDLPTRPPDPVPSMKFRAYADHIAGAADYWSFVAGRYPTAFARLNVGDPGGFVQQLKAHGYFTADEGPYERAVVRLFAEFNTKILSRL